MWDQASVGSTTGVLVQFIQMVLQGVLTAADCLSAIASLGPDDLVDFSLLGLQTWLQCGVAFTPQDECFEWLGTPQGAAQVEQFILDALDWLSQQTGIPF